MRKFLVLVTLPFLFLFLSPDLFAQAANHVVISEVGPMGGSSSSTNTGEFIELYNPLSTDVTFGSNVVITSGEATGSNNAAWTQSLSGKTVKAYGFLLIGDGGVTVTPDVSFPGGKNLANSGTRSYVQLKDGANIIDAFGWDPSSVSSPNCEGTAFHPSTTSSDKKTFERKSGALATSDDNQGNAWDTGDNSVDFFENTSAQANPQNSSSPIEVNPYNITPANGVGSVNVSPAIFKYDASTTLTFSLKSTQSDTLKGLKIVKPAVFTWNSSSFSANPNTVNISQSGDTTIFSNFSLTGTDSIVITIPAVTSIDSTNEFAISVLTSKDGSNYSLLSALPKPLVYGLPRSIAQIKAKESNGVHTLIGKWVVTKGVVTVAKEFGGPSYLQDNTAGFALYDSSVTNNVELGDEIVVLGKVSPFYELFELSPGSILEKTAEGVHYDTLAPTISQVKGQDQNGLETYESRLIKISGIEKVETTNNSPATSWSVTGSGTNYNLISGSDTLEIRITSGTDIVNLPVPSGKFSVVGVLGQFNSFYQIMPRSYKDITAESNGPQIISQSPYESAINTTNITFSFQTDVPGNTIINYGETNSYGNFATDENLVTNHQIVLGGLTPSTIYHIRIGTTNNSDTTYTQDYIVETSSSNSSGTINVYFNKSVDNSVSAGENAVQASLSQKFIDRINAATVSIDAALYSLSGTVGANIANALIAAKSRGVKVRVIGEYDNHTTAPWTTLSNGGIPVIFDNYDASNGGNGLMHNKFGVFDNRDTSGTNDWVWSGSWNATDPGTNNDAQNVIEIQDKSLANAYRIEFEEMWGSNTDSPNASNSRFGARKTDNTPHLFNIAGTHIEVYFDPSDNTTLHIGDALQAANSSINIAMLTFTRNDLASILVNKKNAGEKVRVILDNNTDTGTEFNYLQSSGVDVLLKGSSLGGLLHHKYAIIDAEVSNADQVTITGSHNWSSAAENYNNENTLIIHSKRITNLYYQEFKARYIEAGGSDNLTDVEKSTKMPTSYKLMQNYPNPFNPSTIITYSIPKASHVTLRIFNVLGQEVRTLVSQDKSAGTFSVSFDASGLSSGIYFYQINAGDFYQVKKMLLMK